jgi:hypothetical protein
MTLVLYVSPPVDTMYVPAASQYSPPGTYIYVRPWLPVLFATIRSSTIADIWRDFPHSQNAVSLRDQATLANHVSS